MIPLLIAGGLAATKFGVDAYKSLRQERAARRLEHRQEGNQESQDHDSRRAAIMRSLGVDLPMIGHTLTPLGHGTDTSGADMASGLLGLGSNLASLYAAQAGPQLPAPPTDVPMPYQGQSYPSAYGPGSRIKPGTPYR